MDDTTKKVFEFIHEVRHLMKKHNIEVIEEDEYDGTGTYSGTNYNIKHRGKYFSTREYGETIGSLIASVPEKKS